MKLRLLLHQHLQEGQHGGVAGLLVQQTDVHLLHCAHLCLLLLKRKLLAMSLIPKHAHKGVQW